jgi:hypothetical protein
LYVIVRFSKYVRVSRRGEAVDHEMASAEVSLGMKLDFAAHTDLVAEFTVRLHDGRVEVPVRADFDFFEDVDASFAAVAVTAFRHVW